MNLSWSNTVIKYVLFVFNLLFVISGIIMIAVGVSVKTYYTDYDIFLDSNYFSLPNLLIAIGSLIFFISFFGCCGAIKESWFMIFIFSVLLILIFILEFSAGIAGYVLRDRTASFLSESLTASMVNYKANIIQPPSTPKPAPTEPPTAAPTSASIDVNGKSGNSTVTRVTRAATEDTNPTTRMWDIIQREFKCCGADKPEDWQSTPLFKDTDLLPVSCCDSLTGIVGTSVCSLNRTSTATYHKIGCVTGFGDYLKSHAVTLGGVGIAIAFIQLFGIILACHLTKKLKNQFYST